MHLSYTAISSDAEINPTSESCEMDFAEAKLAGVRLIRLGFLEAFELSACRSIKLRVSVELPTWFQSTAAQKQLGQLN